MRLSILFGSLLFLLSISVCHLHAGDEGLYGKEPPANASFFRILNASDSGTVDLLVEGVKLTSIAPLKVSPYGFSTKTRTRFTLGGKALSLDTPPGGMMTLVWDGENTLVIGEEPFSSKKKARLKLFNISDEPVSLWTVNNKTEVIHSVAENGYGYRDVKALTLPFLVKDGDKTLLTTDNIALAKGVASSLFYIKNGGSNLYITSEEKR